MKSEVETEEAELARLRQMLASIKDWAESQIDSDTVDGFDNGWNAALECVIGRLNNINGESK